MTDLKQDIHRMSPYLQYSADLNIPKSSSDLFSFSMSQFLFKYLQKIVVIKFQKSQNHIILHKSYIFPKRMAQKSEQQIKGEEEQNVQQESGHQQEQQLSEADKKVYDQIFKSLNKIDKKVKDAKTKLHNNENTKKQQKNTNFKQIAEKLIESKQNSDIVNKQDLSSDIGQSFERAVIDIYSQNQKLKKKQAEMQKIIKDQNHKIFQQKSKQQALTKQIQKLRLELAQAKDNNIMVNRSVTKADNLSDNKKQTSKKGQTHNQNNEDYDFWNMPQNESYNKKKKQFVENSGLWVNQKNVNDSMFITEGRR